MARTLAASEPGARPGDDEIGLVRVEQPPDVFAGADLQAQFDARMLVAERGQHRGQDMLAGGGHGREPHPAVLGISIAAGRRERLLLQTRIARAYPA